MTYIMEADPADPASIAQAAAAERRGNWYALLAMTISGAAGYVWFCVPGFFPMSLAVGVVLLLYGWPLLAVLAWIGHSAAKRRRNMMVDELLIRAVQQARHQSAASNASGFISTHDRFRFK